MQWYLNLLKNFSLYVYQNDIVRKVIERNSYALFVEMGLGKTLMALTIVLLRVLKGEVNRVLVVCPKTVADSWMKEVDRLKAYAGFYLSIDVKNYSNESVKNINLKDLSRYKYDLAIDIINFEKLIMLEDLPDYDMVIIDESTRVKNPGAKRTVALFQKLLSVPYRLVLTGSPIVRDVGDLWTQLYLVDAITLDYKEFRKKIKKDKDKWIEYAGDNVVYITKEDIEKLGIMKFPKKVYREVKFELSDEAKTFYYKMKELVKKRILIEDRQRVLATLIQMQRITSGFNPFTLKEFSDNRKKKILATLIKSGIYEPPYLIWASFIRDIMVVNSALSSMGLKGVAIYGATPFKQRKSFIDEFQKGNFDYIVAHPTVLGIGVTLTRSNVCFYYSNSFKFEDRVQSEDRIHRVNQEKDICYYVDLLAKDSIDELILNNLKNKRNLSEMSLTELSKEIVG